MSAESSGGSITSFLNESRVFTPPVEFARQANVPSMERYQELWDRAKADPEGFWGEMAQVLTWGKPWEKVLDWQTPHAKWFVGATINASYNCVDRHCEGANRNKAALIFEGEPGDRRVLRYQDLQREVATFANVLKGLGVKTGDVVAIYMPMIPEAVIAMLACARIGRRTRSSSADSAPRPSPVGFRIARPRCSSPPTAGSAEGRSSRSRRTPTVPWPIARRSRAWSSTSEPATRSR